MSARRLRVELAPSPLLAAAILILHCAAAASILAVLPGPAAWALGALVMALGVVLAWSRALLRTASSVRALELAGPQLEIQLASGESFATEVAARRYVGRFMVTLPVLRPTRRTILVTRDMVRGDLFRCLRIWALWGKLPTVAVKQLSL